MSLVNELIMDIIKKLTWLSDLLEEEE